MKITLYVPILVDREGHPVLSSFGDKPIHAGVHWTEDAATETCRELNDGQRGEDRTGWYWTSVEFEPVPF